MHRLLSNLVMDTGVEDSDDEHDGHFWEDLTFIVAVLGPVFKLMRLTDSSAPLMGKFYKLMSELGGELDDIFEEGKPFAKEPYLDYKEAISDAHTHQWTRLHCSYHAAGYALDPNFLCDDVNGVNDGEVFTGLNEVIERHYHDDEAAQGLALQQYGDFRMQRGFFAKSTLKAAAKSMPAYEWWELVGGGVQALRKVAMKVLSKTTSASACERNWSAFQAVQSSKRNRLSSRMLNDLVYVRSNLRLQQSRIDPDFKETVAEWVRMAEVDGVSDDEQYTHEQDAADACEEDHDVVLINPAAATAAAAVPAVATAVATAVVAVATA